MNTISTTDPHVLLAVLSMENDDVAQREAKTDRARAEAAEEYLLEQRIDALEDQADARFAGGIMGGIGQIASGGGRIADAISSASSKSGDSGDSDGCEASDGSGMGDGGSMDAEGNAAKGGQTPEKPHLFEASGTIAQGSLSIAQAVANHGADGEGQRAERLEMRAKDKKREGEEASEEIGAIQKNRERVLELLKGIEENNARTASAALLRG